MRTKSKHKNRNREMVGPISINMRGVGFFDIPDSDKSVEIQPEKLNRAFHGDIVKVRKTGKKIPKPNQRFGRANFRKNESFSRDREQGEVVRIISRIKNRFVGVVQMDSNTCYLVPDDRRMYTNIRLADSHLLQNISGKKVLAEITDWPEKANEPNGKVVKVIGVVGDNNTEMESIVLEKGFDTDFPREVELEAEKLKKETPLSFNKELKSRRDMRGVFTITIDPFDAKDFDDAISFEDLGDNIYEIGVHIADVSHFVRPGTMLDREAEKRGLSVYLVDRTIPMLPEILSNDLCSLNPDEDKYTFSAVFKITSDGKVLDKWFGKTIIHSNKRFSYEEAQATINNAKNTKDDPLQKELLILRDVARKLEKQKWNNGAINFETEEIKFELDEYGKPIRVYKKSRLDTHKLVEEYMLLANREVAKFIFHSQNSGLKNRQSVYRVHGKPDKERIESLAVFLKALGFDLRNKNGEVTSHDINRLLKEVEGTPNEELIKTATIRSMQKAVYSTKNIGHFGLAFRFYTHFTSPIRRYPDLLVHRFLEREISGGKVEKNEYEKFEKICLASSDLEKKAAEAERASIKYKQVEYMQSRVGQIFDGTITGVTDWGIYIEELETKCEGMVKLRDLTDDLYILDDKNYTIKGKRTGRKFTLGDPVKFKVISADLERKALDYALV